MENPQKENGHVDIANSIMDAFARTRIPGQARQILDFILRKTYGWKKKTDFISLSQFCAGTGLKKTHVVRAVHLLEKMNLIVTQKGNGIAKEYGLNKHFETWNPYPKKVTYPKMVTSIPQNGNASYPKMVPTKDTTTKDTTTKDTLSDSARSLSSQFLATLPETKMKARITEADLRKWGEAFDNLLKLYSAERLAEIVAEYRNDPFWSKNFLSPLKLLKKNSDGIRYAELFDARLVSGSRRSPAPDHQIGTYGRDEPPPPADPSPQETGDAVRRELLRIEGQIAIMSRQPPSADRAEALENLRTIRGDLIRQAEAVQ